MVDISDLLGVPYKLHGRSKSGFDCYGLVIEVEKRFGHKMADLYTESKDGINLVDFVCENINKVDVPELSDVLLFYDGNGRVCHIGVKLNKDDFIHCDGRGVNVDKLSRYSKNWEAFRWQN